VSNADPTVHIVTAPGSPVTTGASVSVGAAVADAGANDSLSCSIAWGDGAVATGTISGGGTCTGSHTFTTAGSMTVTVSVTDDDGSTATATTVIVVNAPPPPSSGCVRDRDYWLSSSNPKSAVYNNAWNAVGGPSAPFFLSDKNWKSALSISASNTVYWNLAHGYITATLNVAAGATPPPAVSQALDDARSWLTVTKPSKARETAAVASIIKQLDRFNDGRLGPPRCNTHDNGNHHGHNHGKPRCRIAHR
jgi:hypothetical protein